MSLLSAAARIRGRFALGWNRLLAGLLVGLLVAPAFAADPLGRAEEVKAAFILNIARFVEWPTEHGGNRGQRLQLCLYRGNPLGSAIRTIRGKRVAGRELGIQTVYRIPEVQSCNILFVPHSELERFGRESERTAGRPMLTITDLTVFGEELRGYPDILVALVRQGNRIGFDINLSAIQRSGLRISSELLKLGRNVGTH